MIYKLAPHMEFNNWSNEELDIISKLHVDLGVSCLILNKYKLVKSIIKDKSYQVKDFTLVDLDKIEQSSIIVYHPHSIFAGMPGKITELIDYCNDNDKDLFLPVKNGSDLKMFIDTYDNIEVDDIRIIVRDLKIKSLL